MPFGITSRAGFAEFPYIIDNAYCIAAISTPFMQ
jgi:hypothetical protein